MIAIDSDHSVNMQGLHSIIIIIIIIMFIIRSYGSCGSGTARLLGTLSTSLHIRSQDLSLLTVHHVTIKCQLNVTRVVCVALRCVVVVAMNQWSLLDGVRSSVRCVALWLLL